MSIHDGVVTNMLMVIKPSPLTILVTSISVSSDTHLTKGLQAGMIVMPDDELPICR